MTNAWWSDDGELLAALTDALQEARDVPREFVARGKAAYALHDIEAEIDAELAALTYDSAANHSGAGRQLAVTRAEPAPLRALTFAAARLKIQIQVTDKALQGQIVPPQRAEIELRTEDGRRPVTVDEIGWFAIRPIPAGSFWLHCRTESGMTVLTDRITL
jgi:hypothetical protein